MTALATEAQVKACSSCGEILPADPDDERAAEFFARVRDEWGRVITWRGQCKRCIAATKRRRMRQLGVPPRDETVDAGPFIDWMRDMVARDGSGALASRLGINGSRIRSLVRGYQWHRGKRYRTKRVTVDLADRWLLLLDGPSIYELWPHLREE